MTWGPTSTSLYTTYEPTDYDLQPDSLRYYCPTSLLHSTIHPCHIQGGVFCGEQMESGNQLAPKDRKQHSMARQADSVANSGLWQHCRCACLQRAMASEVVKQSAAVMATGSSTSIVMHGMAT